MKCGIIQGHPGVRTYGTVWMVFFDPDEPLEGQRFLLRSGESWLYRDLAEDERIYAEFLYEDVREIKNSNQDQF